jgi:alkylhydroperoxidase family enzyme
VSRDDGIAEADIFELQNFRNSPRFSASEKTALEYAEEMCQTPVAVSDELFARLREHFEDDQIVELTASIAYENYRARFYHALEIGSDDLFVCAWSPEVSAKTQSASAKRETS